VSERETDKGGQFNTLITVWSAKGRDISLLLRPEDDPDPEHWIEIEFDEIDNFCELLQELKQEQGS